NASDYCAPEILEEQTMRIRMLAAAVMLLAAVTTPALPRPALAASSTDDLARAALTANEVGGGFEEIHAGPVDDLAAANVPSYAAAFMKAPTLLNPTFSVVTVVLIDAEAAEAAGPNAVGGADAINSLGLKVTPAGSAGLGEESQRFAVSGEIA